MSSRKPAKYALCIAINYAKTPYALQGCLEDNRRIVEYLTTQGYQIKSLIEEKATAAAIKAALAELAAKAVSGDSLFLHYSGHGSLLPDDNNEESTGYDSTIVPYDFLTGGQIRDDHINSLLVQKLRPNVNLFGLLDSCCSGSGFDLRYQIIDQSRPVAQDLSGWLYTLGSLDTSLLFRENKKYPKLNTNVYMMSGCQDFQTSADAYINGKYTGALTDSFMRTVKAFNKANMKWKHLLYNTRGFLRQQGFTQIPQLSCANVPNLEANVSF